MEHSAGEESGRTAIKVAAREADRARVLRAVMSRLNEATTIPQVASAVVEDVIRALGADGGSSRSSFATPKDVRPRSNRCASRAT